MDYYDIYEMRRTRNGNNPQERIINQRVKAFKRYMERSVYKIEFNFNDDLAFGVFEEYKQDETKTLGYLLTELELKIPNGTIITIEKNDASTKYWMVYFLEYKQASGYNRYILLRMTHELKWTDREGITRKSLAYMYGQENNMLKDELRSRSRSDVLYTENLKTSFFIMPRNQYLKKDDYFIVGEEPYQEYYRVTGYDRQSTEGVEFVTVDPIYEYDLTEPPHQTEEDEDKDFFWLNGGK